MWLCAANERVDEDDVEGCVEIDTTELRLSVDSQSGEINVEQEGRQNDERFQIGKDGRNVVGQAVVAGASWGCACQYHSFDILCESVVVLIREGCSKESEVRVGDHDSMIKPSLISLIVFFGESEESS